MIRGGAFYDHGGSGETGGTFFQEPLSAQGACKRTENSEPGRYRDCYRTG
jgi:hypothetical protein